ncbi:MAG: hypothetical protein WB439_16050 [Acidobacteriaceae bacterium]
MAAPGVHAQTEGALPNAPSALLFSGSTSTQPGVLPNEPAGATQVELADAATPMQQASASTLGTPWTQALGQTPAVQTRTSNLPPCPKRSARRAIPIIFLPATLATCEDQLQLIVDTGYVRPLTSAQKGELAIRAVIDPFNLLAIATFSGVSVAVNSHSVYGPGFKGWGKLAGYSLAEDSQADFTGIYVIPSLVQEDPRYHRMPQASVRRRIAHALIHTFVSQHDDGSLMPNYATILNVPLSAEISNLYVPDIGTNVPDTAKRILVGYATDPIGPLVAEFLPDVAKRVHVHIIFAQQILNRLALGSGAASTSY